VEAEERPVPAVLEYIPYRKNDFRQLQANNNSKVKAG